MVNQIIPIDKYFLPNNIKEALHLFEVGRKNYYPISGGTSLAFSKPKGIRGIVDLSRAGLNYVKKQKDSIRIGAATPVSELIKNPLFSSYFGGVVKDAALTLATTPLRNLITVGGNVLRIYPWSSLPVLFLSLGGEFLTLGKRESNIFETDVFFSSQPRSRLKNGQILKEISLPKDEQSAKGAFLKFALTKTDFALLNIAVVLRTKKGKCIEARVVVGAVASLPIRLAKAEKVLNGVVITKDVLKSAALAGAESIKPLRDFRVSDDYKIRIAPALIEQCLVSAWERFGKAVT
jgi:CO/xanthine dehydrogenase FAD-binding subunit